MSKRNEAFHKVMSELKGRIQDHSSERLRRKAQDPVNGGEHEEPDGDEDSEGREPAGPEEAYSGEEPEGLETSVGTQFDKKKKLMPEEKEEPSGGCSNCGMQKREGDKYCGGCGRQHGS